jgi:Tfp pilus assembly protein PilF
MIRFATRLEFLLGFILCGACQHRPNDGGAPIAQSSQTAAVKVAAPAASTSALTVKPSPALKPGKAPLDAAAKAKAKRYLSALGRGRKATVKQDYSAAVAAFDEALKLEPRDARALAERGYAKYLAGDLDGGAQDFRLATPFASDPKLRAQIAFNQGLVEKKQGATAQASACPVTIDLEPKLTTTPEPNFRALWAQIVKDHNTEPDPDPLNSPSIPEGATDDVIAQTLAAPRAPADGIWLVSLFGQRLSSSHAYAVRNGKLWLLPMLSGDFLPTRCPAGVNQVGVGDDGAVPIIETVAEDGAEAFMCQKPNGDSAECDGSDNQGEPMQSFCAYGSYTIRSFLLDRKTFTVLAIVEESGVDSDARVAAHTLVNLDATNGSIEVTGAGCHLKEPLPAAPHPG